MKRSLVLAFPALALTAFAMLGGPPATLAQNAPSPQTTPCPPATIRPFDGDANALKGDAGEVRLLVEACEQGRVVALSNIGFWERSIVPDLGPGPPYRSGLKFNLCHLTEQDLPGTSLEMRYFVGSRNRGYGNFILAADEEPPRITEVVPPTGTKVRPGRRITVKVTASEAYRDGNRGWQTGVKSIRVEDLTSHSDLRPWTNDSARPQHCHDKTWTKTHDMEFTVPDPSPASVVRLRVTVRDYAGKESTQDISYPTVGDWHGTFTMQSAGRYFTRADIILKDDGRGNLTGTMEGQQRTDYSWDDGRCYQRTIRPNNFRVSLVGSHTQVQQGSTLKVFIKEIEETKVIEEIWCRGAVPPVRQELGFKMRVWGGEALLGTPSPLGEGELLPDGSRKYTFDLSPTTANVTMRRVRDEAR